MTWSRNGSGNMTAALDYCLAVLRKRMEELAK